MAPAPQDYQALFQRLSIDLGSSSPDRRALPTDERLATYTRDGADPELEALHFQFGRYLLIASSRNALPANLQGLWNQSKTPPWNADYHTNINVQMNYWPAEVSHLAELARPSTALCKACARVAPRGGGAGCAGAKRCPASGRDCAPGTTPSNRPFETFLPTGKPARGWTVRTESNPSGPWATSGTRRQRLVRAALLGALRLHAGPPLPARHGLPGAEGGCAVLGDHRPLPDGRLIAPGGWSPEHGPVEDGVSYDQQILWELFDATARAAQVLG